MIECRRCGAKTPNTFLCGRCTDGLRQNLQELPWWLNRLTETALGHTKMSDNGGRRSAPRTGLNGDTALAACIEQLPRTEDDLDKARRERQKLALAHALAAGGLNARACELSAQIADSLGYWIRVLCEQRNLRVPELARRPGAGDLKAHWLWMHHGAIVQSEDAADIAGDVDGHLDDIVRTVNRPLRVWYLGDCPAWDDKRDTQCGQPLRAPEGSIETYCPRCHATHNVNRLFLARVDQAEREVVTFKEILSINRGMPAEYQIAARTLQHWRASGLLRPHQWLRPDGRKGLTQHGADDVPLFSWADVKRLQLRKPQRAATGASAHRKGDL
jgi:hypothetical protein